jgi:hypothetical protein
MKANQKVKQIKKEITTHQHFEEKNGTQQRTNAYQHLKHQVLSQEGKD